VSERKRPFSPITASDKKNNPQNIKYIPPVIFSFFFTFFAENTEARVFEGY